MEPMIKKTCQTCELYAHCSNYGELPKDEKGCKDWEISYAIYEDLPKNEAKETLKEYIKNHGEE